MLLSTPALGHKIANSSFFYPPACCSGEDCREVNCTSITETKDGYEWNGFKFRRDQLRDFKAPGCHTCVTPYGTPMCIQIPFGS